MALFRLRRPLCGRPRLPSRIGPPRGRPVAHGSSPSPRSPGPINEPTAHPRVAAGHRTLVPGSSGWSTRRRSTRRWTCATPASLAPVDTNLHPGGFNNLTPGDAALAVQAAMAAIEKICPEAKNLLLIPQRPGHDTPNLMNLHRMADLSPAGLNVRLGTLDEAITEPTPVGCPRARTSCSNRWWAQGRLGLKGFDPCTILLNDDLSAGVPPPLEPARAVPAAAAARGLGDAAPVQPFPRLRGGGEEVRQTARHGPVADQPDVRAAAGGPSDGTGAECLTARLPQRRRVAGQDPAQVQGAIRHPREAIHHRQGRRRRTARAS